MNIDVELTAHHSAGRKWGHANGGNGRLCRVLNKTILGDHDETVARDPVRGTCCTLTIG